MEERMEKRSRIEVHRRKQASMLVTKPSLDEMETRSMTRRGRTAATAASEIEVAVLKAVLGAEVARDRASGWHSPIVDQEAEEGVAPDGDQRPRIDQPGKGTRLEEGERRGQQAVDDLLLGLVLVRKTKRSDLPVRQLGREVLHGSATREPGMSWHPHVELAAGQRSPWRNPTADQTQCRPSLQYQGLHLRHLLSRRHEGSELQGGLTRHLRHRRRKAL